MEAAEADVERSSDEIRQQLELYHDQLRQVCVCICKCAHRHIVHGMVLMCYPVPVAGRWRS
jgi:hypothetical protein